MDYDVSEAQPGSERAYFVKNESDRKPQNK
jgi:hypothetical protein